MKSEKLLLQSLIHVWFMLQPVRIVGHVWSILQSVKLAVMVGHELGDLEQLQLLLLKF